MRAVAQAFRTDALARLALVGEITHGHQCDALVRIPRQVGWGQAEVIHPSRRHRVSRARREPTADIVTRWPLPPFKAFIDTPDTCGYRIKVSGSANPRHSYSPTLFHAVGRVLGEVDLAAIPIGSYEPRWHLHLQHTDPEGAVRMALQMNAKRSVGVHWGTWLMSDEACEWVGSTGAGFAPTRWTLGVV